MTKDEVIQNRDRLKCGKDVPLCIFLDNAILLNEKTDFILWDDTVGVFHVFRSNMANTNVMAAPIQIDVIDYDVIQGMRIQATQEIYDAYVAQLGTIMSDKQKEHIKKSLVFGFSDLVK